MNPFNHNPRHKHYVCDVRTSDEEVYYRKLIVSLESACDFIYANRLAGLQDPSVPVNYLIKVMSTSHEDFACGQLDKLFRHFLLIDARDVPPEYATTVGYRESTLLYIIRSHDLRISRSPSKLEMMSGWRNLLHKFIDKQGCVARERRRSFHKFNYLRESMNLRDVTWLLDGHSHNRQADDPYDLRDVIWMYDENEGIDSMRIKSHLEDLIQGMWDFLSR